MVIGVLSIEIHIPYKESIKEKRNRIRSIKDRVRKKFNVSVAEVDSESELLGSATIAVVAVSNSSDYLNSVLSNVFNLIERGYSDIITSYKTDFIIYE